MNQEGPPQDSQIMSSDQMDTLNGLAIIIISLVDNGLYRVDGEGEGTHNLGHQAGRK